MSAGGLRVYTDEAHRPGTRLELELRFASGATAVVLAEVVWTETLPAGFAATYETGLRYIDCSPESLDCIRREVAAAAE